MHRREVDHALDLWQRSHLEESVREFARLCEEAGSQDRAWHPLHSVLFGSYVFGLPKHADGLRGIEDAIRSAPDSHDVSRRYFWIHQLTGRRPEAWTELLRFCARHGPLAYDDLIADLHRVLVSEYCREDNS